MPNPIFPVLHSRSRQLDLGDEADGGYLPPWDRAVRVALAVGGPQGAEARFDWLREVTKKN